MLAQFVFFGSGILPAIEILTWSALVGVRRLYSVLSFLGHAMIPIIINGYIYEI